MGNEFYCKDFDGDSYSCFCYNVVIGVLVLIDWYDDIVLIVGLRFLVSVYCYLDDEINY